MKDQSKKLNLKIQSLEKQLGDKNKRIQQLNKLRIQDQNKKREQSKDIGISDDMFSNLFSVMKIG